MDKLLDIVNSLDLQVPNRGYWYLRTDAGFYYEQFRDNNYIAINFNYVHPSVLEVNNEAQLRRLITNNVPKFDQIPYEELQQGNKSTVSKYIGILRSFHGMQTGDIVIIPSADSDTFSIGKINDSRIYLPSEEETIDCPYLLRRRVNWVKKDAFIPPYSPILYSLKHSHSALTKIEKHSEYINAIMQPLFFQNDRYYFTLNINKEEDIPLVDLKNLLDSYYEILLLLNEAYGFSENIENAIIKLNLNSKGKLNLIQEKTVSSVKSLAAASVLLTFFTTSSCDTNELVRKTDIHDVSKVQKLKNEIEKFNDSRGKLRIPNESIN